MSAIAGIGNGAVSMTIGQRCAGDHMPRLTPSGKKTAVADVEDKLTAEASKKGFAGRRADAYKYGTLNKIGLMRGNKVTAKGKRAAKGK